MLKKKLEETAPISYQCSPSSEPRYLPATAVPKFELQYFATLVRQCPDVRIKLDDGDNHFELGLKLSNDLASFLGIPNNPNMADYSLSYSAATLFVIDDPKQGTWNVDPAKAEAERNEALQDQFSAAHGGCGAHLGGRP